MANYLSGFLLLKAAALSAAAAFIAPGQASAAIDPPGQERAGSAKCTLGISGFMFPTLAAGKNSYGMTGNSSFSVNCHDYPGWITPWGQAGPDSGGLKHIGMPFCVVLRANGEDARFTAQGQRVLYRDGRVHEQGRGRTLTFNFFTNYRSCRGAPGNMQTPFCTWGGSADAPGYGAGYPSFMFNGGLSPNAANKLVTLNYGAQITAGQGLYSGTYSNTFTAILYYNDYQWDSSATLRDYLPGASGVVLPDVLCTPRGQHFKGTRMAVSRIKVSGFVSSSCRSVIPPSAVNFGTAMKIEGIKPQSGTINVGCSAGTTIQLGISDGNNPSGDPSSGGWRGMGCTSPYTCGERVIYYNIYKDLGRRQIWGDIGSESAMWGLVAGETNRLPFYAAVAPAAVQSSLGTPMPPALGTYKDTLIITLQSVVNGLTE